MHMLFLCGIIMILILNFIYQYIPSTYLNKKLRFTTIYKIQQASINIVFGKINNKAE